MTDHTVTPLTAATVIPGDDAAPGVTPGTVYLVGAGPGDPGLLTRHGADALARADVVVYDRLADNSMLGARAGRRRADLRRQAGGRPRRAAEAHQRAARGARPRGQVRRAPQGRRPVRVRPRRRGGHAPARARRAVHRRARRQLVGRRAGLRRHPGHRPAVRQQLRRHHRARGPDQAVLARRLGRHRQRRGHARLPHGAHQSQGRGRAARRRGPPGGDPGGRHRARHDARASAS